MGFKSDGRYNFFLSDPEELFQIGLRSSKGHHTSFQAQAVSAETYRPKYLHVVLNKCCNLKLSEFSKMKPTSWHIFCEKIFFVLSALSYGGRSLSMLACAKHSRFQSRVFGENQMHKCGY